jgi:hypothetical protein
MMHLPSQEIKLANENEEEQNEEGGEE